MKLKRKILCPLFLISLFLPSCSSIGTTSSIQNIGQTSTPVESSDTSSSVSSSSSYPYVTETLREGFHVQPGIPDRNGTIDTTALSGLLDTIEDRLDLGSVFSKYRSNLSEATPLLRQGGWTTQTIKEIGDVLSSESLFHAAHSGKGFRDAVELSESEIHAIYGKAIQDIIHLLDDDQLSSLLFAMTRVGILSQSNIVLSFSLLESVSLSMIESIASSKEVQSDFMANQYWQGMLSSTPLSSTFLTFLQSDEFNEISWYIFRIVANVVREIAEKIPVEDVIAFIQNMRELSSGPEELTPEMLAAIFPMFGRIFDECFCDRQSFATLAEMMRDALIEAKGSASTLDFVSNAGSDNIVTVSQEGEDTDGILEILKKSDDLFNVLKFAALLVRNMTTEDFRSLIEIDRLDDSDEEVTMQNGRLIVLFSKMYVTNMTRFGADSNQVISSIEDLIPDFLSVVMGTKISLSEVRDESNVYLAEFRSDSVNINSRLAEDVVNLIESSAQHELESLSLADCEEIVGEFTSIGERFGLDDWNSYRYRIEIRHQYQVGEAPVVNVWSDQESIEPILSDLEGFSSVQPHVGMASVSFYQYSVSFSYSVYNEVSPELVQDIYFARTTKTENYFEQHSTLPDVRVQIDGKHITVPSSEILNYSSTTPGQYYATFPIGEEKKDYLGFTYYIYSEKDYQKTIEITTPLYEGQWIGKRTGFQSVNTTSISGFSLIAMPASIL